MRRRAIRSAMIVAVGLLLVPTLSAAAPGPRWSGGGSHGPSGQGSHGWGGPRWHNWSGHGYGHGYGSGWWCCGGFAVGVGVGALLTAPWWAYPQVYAAPGYPYYAPYPAYPADPGYPAYPAAYPAYAPGYPPPPPGGAYPAVPGPPASGAPGSLPPTPEHFSSTPGASPQPLTGAAPSGAGAASAPAPTPAGCETVTVAGHWEMRIYPDGQRLTVWVPTSIRSVCR